MIPASQGTGVCNFISLPDRFSLSRVERNNRTAKNTHLTIFLSRLYPNHLIANPVEDRLDMQDDLSKLRIERSVKTGRKGRFPLRPLLIAAALALCGAAVYAAFFHGAREVETGKAVLAFPSQSLTSLAASGYVVADRKAALATKATGRLIKLNVEEGSRVKAGEVVAQLESRDIEAARDRANFELRAAEHMVDKAEAEYVDAESNYRRMKLLVDKAYVAKSEHDAAKARFDAADAALKNAKSSVNSRKAALEEAEANLEYALIRAPFDGVVLTKNADIGDIISPMSSAANSKAAVVNIADMSSLQVEADVSESNLGLVKQGEPCEIILDAIPGERFPGRVHMIVPTADRSKASVMVKIRFNKLDPRILPEMSAKVAFLSRPLTPDEQKPRLAVDPSAVTERGGKTVVFRIEEGLARLAPVTVGAPVGDLVEITSGLSQGDVIALRPAKALKDGDAVTIKED